MAEGSALREAGESCALVREARVCVACCGLQSTGQGLQVREGQRQGRLCQAGVPWPGKNTCCVPLPCCRQRAASGGRGGARHAEHAAGGRDPGRPAGGGCCQALRGSDSFPQQRGLHFISYSLRAPVLLKRDVIYFIFAAGLAAALGGGWLRSEAGVSQKFILLYFFLHFFLHYLHTHFSLLGMAIRLNVFLQACCRCLESQATVVLMWYCPMLSTSTGE